MKAFRDFGKFKGLVIDKRPIDGEYRVAKTNGEIVYIKERLYNSSSKAEVSELDKLKLELMVELYYDWTCESEEVKVAYAKGLCEDWKRLFIEDELVTEEEFGAIFRKELYYRTYKEIGQMGYKFALEADSDVCGPGTRFVYKEFPMPKALKRWESKLRLTGVDREGIYEMPEFSRLLEAFLARLKKGDTYPFKIQNREWGIDIFEAFVPHFDTEVISHICGFSIEGLPMTRELAIEAAERMLGKRR